GENVLGSAVVKADGTYHVEIAKQAAGTQVEVTATDEAGHVSEATTVIVVDQTAPEAPMVDGVTEETTTVTGQAEAGTTITVKAGENVLGSAVVKTDGTYHVEIASQAAGTQVEVTATDEAGHVSEATTVIVVDQTAPEAPMVDEITDQTTAVTGQAEAGSTVTVKAGENELGSAVVKADGTYHVEIAKQAVGTQVEVTATDEAGHVSEATIVIVVDQTAPEAPEVEGVTEETTTVTGQAEAGTTITVKVGENVLGSAVVKADGTYHVEIAKQAAGTQVEVTATDEAGHVSEATTVIVVDQTAPEAPEVEEVTDQTTAVTGQAEAGSTITVKAGENVLGSAVVKADGTYHVEIASQAAGTQVEVTATDEAGHVSEATIVIVVDQTAPEAPMVDEITDQSTAVTGQAEAGSTVTVKAGENVLGSAVVESDGTYHVEIAKQAAGTQVEVTATDEAGHVSEATKVIVVDQTAPEAPMVDEITDQSTAVTGQAEAGSTVTVKAGENVLGSAVVESDGTYHVEIAKQAAGTQVEVTATDEAGHVSEATKVIVVDQTAPEAPMVDEITDQTTAVTGQAEAGSTVTVKAGENVLGSAVVESDGTYHVEIAKQAAGTQVEVTATDEAGHVSEATKVIVVDQTAPEAPMVDEITDQTTAVTGQAEAGSTVTVKAGENVLGSAVVKADGAFTVQIEKQYAATVLSIVATDQAGNQSNVQPVTVELDSAWKKWEKKTTDDRFKKWTIAFNALVNSSTINFNEIYVTNSEGISTPALIQESEDGMSVEIIPSQSYKVGESYYLYISDGLESEKGQLLSEKVMMEFEILD
ncbi:Ig-like domain-containing protein, partial [Alkalihalobacillus deserti]|uniref:Ig-like domain-containing protein n=1 Tax=Alkalihalobacillus deserti TaxID=2879466 RepID=UPI001D1482A5